MLADLFNPIKPPEVRESDVSRRHSLGITPKNEKVKRVYYVGRTEQQKARRRELTAVRRKMRAAQERAG